MTKWHILKITRENKTAKQYFGIFIFVYLFIFFFFEENANLINEFFLWPLLFNL